MNSSCPTLLVVDDDVAACNNLNDILTDLGFTVDVAHDPLQALELVRNRSYDVALLDLKMPIMDGVSLYREIRKLRSETVAIIVTAHVSNNSAEEAREAGAWEIMPKPLDLPELLRQIQVILDQPLVLVIDDDSELCRNLWDILRQDGYRVGVAHDSREAEQKLCDNNFQVVLIDMKLPLIDGPNLFKLVQTCNPAARTIIITGHAQELESHLHDMVQGGADAVCYKPFDMNQLLGTLNHLCGKISS